MRVVNVYTDRSKLYDMLSLVRAVALQASTAGTHANWLCDRFSDVSGHAPPTPAPPAPEPAPQGRAGAGGGGGAAGGHSHHERHVCARFASVQLEQRTVRIDWYQNILYKLE